MPEPHATTAGAIAAGGGLLTAQMIAPVIGVPYDLLGWASFGGLMAIASATPAQEGWRLVAAWAMGLAIAAGFGGIAAPIAVPAAVGLAAKVGIALPDGAPAHKFAAMVCGFSTAFLPEAMRYLKGRLGAAGGGQP